MSKLYYLLGNRGPRALLVIFWDLLILIHTLPCEFANHRAGSQLKICPIVKSVSVFVKNKKSVIDASSDDTARTSACGGILWFSSTGTNYLALVKFDIIPSVSKGMTGYDKVHVKSV